MTDADGLLAARFAATRDAFDDSDWNDVLGRLQPRTANRTRAVLLGVALAAVIAVVALATPLGAAIVHRVGDFSAWLTGEPGSPVSKKEQRAFNRANARSWLGFPPGTQLRRLISVRGLPGGKTVDLLGFRSGDTLCLQVVVSGRTRATTRSCAPVEELRHSVSPVHVVLADSGFGKGKKRAWYGLDRFEASAVQVTAGIAADGVRGVIVQDRSGKHTARTRSNAFLYVAANPGVGQRVEHVWARTATGLVTVPFAPVAFGLGAGIGGNARGPIRGPSQVERHVRNGTIGWLDRHEPRGQPLDVLPRRNRALVERHAVFGRVVAPDPTLPIRLAITLSTSRHGHKAIGLCSWLYQAGGMAGGCAVRADLFAEVPFTADMSLMSGSDEFETVSGLASDDVSRIEVFFASGPSLPVSLADNTFVVAVARGRTPFRLVAYDSDDRVIGIISPSNTEQNGPGPAPGRARPLLHAVSSNGATAVLSVGASTGGGTCMYVREKTNRANGVSLNCREPRRNGPALLLENAGSPTQFLSGRVRRDVAAIELRFADGVQVTIKPTRGFVLYGVAPSHVRPGHELIAAVARNGGRRKVGSESFRPHPG